MDFDTAFDRLIGHEGGYTRGKNDPGGETKFGISKRSYPHLNIKNVTREQSRKIYLTDFWQRIQADKLYDGVAWQVFDFAVNSGIDTAVRKLQSALNVADDGWWGPITSAAARSMSETDQIMRLIAYRQLFQASLSNWKYAGKGWAVRNANNLLYGAEDT